ncbi:acyltransferase [Acinetobacter variabilis]|uniref:acyltransferase family protein n=1 Tax=Acinetobacter variabilis TaxID=70346 RepID=UPI0021CF7BA4|nr:acyltransferase [Acinetobacter variabilis]MCU4373718.1 acyltransferase [Acinetobacter variabilis]
MERFEALDSLRGVCAILVVFFHLNIFGAFTEFSFFRNSSIFVEFFFVLSGFVLAHSYLNKSKIDAKKYLVSRFFRIVPMHWFMLMMFILMNATLLVLSKIFHLNFPIEPFTGKNAYSEIIPNLILIQAWLPSFNALSFNGPAWSISVEFYLYMIFLAGLLVFRKNIFIFSFILMIFGVLGLIFNYELTTHWAYRGLSCFFAGVISYMIYQKVKISSKFLEIILVFIVVWFVTQFKEIPYGSAIAPFLFSFVVYAFAHENGVVSKALKIKFFKKMGELSFSIYIVHYFIITVLLSVFVLLSKLGFNFASKVNGIWMMDLNNLLLNNILPFLILGVVIFISMFTRKYIEDRFIQIGKRISNK